MPKRTTPHQVGTKKYLENCSFEPLCAHWFAKAGWQVFTPLFDHGHHTDLLVSDGPKYYRIQVKTVEDGSDDFELVNRWGDSDVHYVAVFAKNSSWGIVFPAFAEKHRKLKDTGGQKFELKQRSFMKAFHSLQ
jgi:hypothetical protein